MVPAEQQMMSNFLIDKPKQTPHIFLECDRDVYDLGCSASAPGRRTQGYITV